MQTQTSPRQSTSTLTWAVAGLGIVLLFLLLLSFMAETRPPTTDATADDGASSVAYLEFGLTTDTLWLAQPGDPSDRRALYSVPHAAEYGIIPALSPDRARFAYTTLAAGVAAPGPDSPAEVWVGAFDGDGAPVRLAGDVDLLVPPVWTPAGDAVIYRRTTAQGQALVMSDTVGSAEQLVVTSASEAIFPVGFDPGGRMLYFIGLSEANGSSLYTVDLMGGAVTPVARLSTGLTRDWVLSRDARRLAFLEVAFGEAEVASRAFVLDLEGGSVTAVSGPDELAFGPVWGRGDELAVGAFNPRSGEAQLLLTSSGPASAIAGPETGFEVPLALDAGGGYLVQAFENDSLATPGRSSLVLVHPNGERETIAEGEVTLVGWTRP